MAKSTNKATPQKKAAPAPKAADESKLDALVQAEEEINEESDVEETKESETVTLDAKDKTKAKEEPKVTEVPSTEGNVKLDETKVDSGVDTVAVKLQYAENENVSDEQVARVAETEAAKTSAKVNHSLPNGVAPEQINATVKLNTMITRTTASDGEDVPTPTMQERVGLVTDSALRHKQSLVDQHGRSTTSTETLQLDEIAIPAEDRRATRMQQQIARQSRSANPILRESSSEPLINKARPINVFQAVARAKSADAKDPKNYMVEGADNMVEHLQKTLGLNDETINNGKFLSTLIDTMNTYVKVMNPTAPKTASDVTEQQKIFIGSLKGVLDQETATGVVGLEIIEQYFKVYRNGALRGELPFRAFNEVSPEENRLTNLVYAIQEIANTNRKDTLNTVSIKKLKESVDSENGQLIIVSYLRKG